MGDFFPLDPRQRAVSWLDGCENEDALWQGGVELLEFALVAPYGTTLALEEQDGEIVPILEDGDEEELAYRAKAAELQSGIREFIELASGMNKGFHEDFLCGTAWAGPFFRLLTQPTGNECYWLGEITHSHAVGETKQRKTMREYWKAAGKYDS